MEIKVLNTIEEYHMLAHGDTVVAGVSGGADSMCLLHFLCVLRERYQLTVIAAHINHNLRGEESKRDEDFVRNWCTAQSVPFELLNADVNTLARERAQGLEQCGREVRYAFFSRLAQRYGGKIATAHTASDNTETMLFHIARGTGVKGLCGIPPVRDNIIRPLIMVTRQQVEDYCAQNQVAFVTDSSNLLDGYARNNIRHHVIPVLKEINPRLETAVSRLQMSLTEDQAYLEEKALRALDGAQTGPGVYSCERLAKLERPILSRAVMRCAAQSGCGGCERTHIYAVMNLISQKSGAVNLPGGYYACAHQGLFRVISKEDPAEMWEIPLNQAANFIKNNKKIELTVCTKIDYDKNIKFNKKLLNNTLDYDIISRNSVFRNRRAGDLFSPAGRRFTKTVKKLFIDEKIPREQRGRRILLAEENNVLWIDGFGVCNSAAVSETTKNVLMITAEQAND